MMELMLMLIQDAVIQTPRARVARRRQAEGRLPRAGETEAFVDSSHRRHGGRIRSSDENTVSRLRLV